MNLASVIILLQLAIGLLSNPSLAQNASLQAQATAFANQAITIATQALSQPPQTQLGVIPTSSTVFSPIISSVPTTTDTSTPPPITIIINPPVQAPSLGTVNQTTTPSSTPIIPPPLPVFQSSGSGLNITGETSSSISMYFSPGRLKGDTFMLEVKCDLANLRTVNGKNCLSFISPAAIDITNNTSPNNQIVINGLMPDSRWRFTVTATNSSGAASSSGWGDLTMPN